MREWIFIIPFIIHYILGFITDIANSFVNILSDIFGVGYKNNILIKSGHEVIPEYQIPSSLIDPRDCYYEYDHDRLIRHMNNVKCHGCY